MLTDQAAIRGNTSLSRYRLNISGCATEPGVLQLRDREKLNQPFPWRIGFTTTQSVQSDDLLLKYARFRIHGHKAVHGIITHCKWLATRAAPPYRIPSRVALLLPSLCRVSESVSAGAPLFERCPDSRIAFAGSWIIDMSQAMAMRGQPEAPEQALPEVSWLEDYRHLMINRKRREK